MMKQIVEGLNKSSLRKAFKRLKRTTKGFTSLIVRDPLDYLDFEVNLDSNLGSLMYEISSSSYHPQKPYLHLSAKSKGINRPTVVFDVKDALVYRFCIEQVEDELITKTRQKNVRGGIKITPNVANDGVDFYEKWFKDWMEHQKSLENCLQHKKFLVSTDIASYFENINILVLKDSVRGDVEKKNGVLNLLFYFLENTRFRNNYEVNTYNGLPQEDIDCSRILAYYFLSPHDQAMAEFCREYDAEYYRFVDDMTIAVNTEVNGKWALKHMAESLRSLNLVSSIEKTSIISSNNAKKELFFKENAHLSNLEQILKNKLKSGENIKPTILEIKKYYRKLIKGKRDTYKNWNKILKRFYSIFTYAKSGFFLDKLIDHLIQYPLLFSRDKVFKYLLQCSQEKKFNKTIQSLIRYLYSPENLYPAIESNIIETLMLIDQDTYSDQTKTVLGVLAQDIFFSTNNYKSLSDYSRALACLLLYRFDNNSIDNVAKHYLKTNEHDYMLTKYLVFVSLTVDNRDTRDKVLKKARKEQNSSISRFVHFVDNIPSIKNNKLVKDSFKKNKIDILYDDKMKLKLEQKVDPIRSNILKKLIAIYQ